MACVLLNADISLAKLSEQVLQDQKIIAWNKDQLVILRTFSHRTPFAVFVGNIDVCKDCIVVQALGVISGTKWKCPQRKRKKFKVSIKTEKQLNFLTNKNHFLLTRSQLLDRALSWKKFEKSYIIPHWIFMTEIHCLLLFLNFNSDQSKLHNLQTSKFIFGKGTIKT